MVLNISTVASIGKRTGYEFVSGSFLKVVFPTLVVMITVVGVVVVVVVVVVVELIVIVSVVVV